MPEGTLVLAEDQALLRQLYTTALRAKGFTVIAVSNGREVLDLIGRVVPKVVVLDINMPEINGIDACRRTRGILGYDIPILFLTASDSTEVLQDCMLAGGSDFLVKTDNIASIIHRIAFWANRHTASQRIQQRPQMLANLEEKLSSGRTTGQDPAPNGAGVDMPAKLRRFLADARSHARTDYGAGLLQYRMFLGYVAAALDLAISTDFTRKPHYWTLLQDCLRPTGALQNEQFWSLLDQWDQSCEDEFFVKGAEAAREDWCNAEASSTIPPFGLAAVLRKSG